MSGNNQYMVSHNDYDELEGYALEAIRFTAKKVANAGGFCESDLEDIEQELALHLYQQLPLYDPALASRNTYISRVIDHRALDLIRAKRRECRNNSRESSLDQVVGWHPEFGQTTLRQQMEIAGAKEITVECDPAENSAHDFSVDISSEVARLQSPIREICEQIMQGERPATISRNLRLSRKTITSSVKTLRKKFGEVFTNTRAGWKCNK